MTITIPDVSVATSLTDGLAVWFIVIACIAAISLIVGYASESFVVLATFAISSIATILLTIGVVVSGISDTSNLKEARTEAIESALDGRIISGEVVDDGILLVETAEGIQRISFNVEDDADLILLTPLSVGDGNGIGVGVEDE